MSTHALTDFSSREFDGKVAKVSPIFRKFDGYPSAHGGELVHALAGRRFYTTSELVAATWSGLLAVQRRRELIWQFCAVPPSQKPDAEWRYSLSLRDENGELPCGGPFLGGPFAAWLKVQHVRTTVYEGPIDQYVPDDEPGRQERGPASSLDAKQSLREHGHPQFMLDLGPVSASSSHPSLDEDRGRLDSNS